MNETIIEMPGKPYLAEVRKLARHNKRCYYVYLNAGVEQSTIHYAMVPANTPYWTVGEMGTVIHTS